MLDNPQSAIVGLNVILMFGLDRISSFWDIAIFIFWCYSLKLPILPILGRFGGIFPQMMSPIVLTPKGPSLHRNTSFEP